VRIDWALLAVAVVAVAAVVAAVLAAPALAGLLLPAPGRSALQAPPAWNVTRALGKPRWWRGYSVEVSSEYRERVLSILKSDPDASKLLSEGYNVTAVRPIIRAVVGGTGEVTLQAKEAVVLLRGPQGFAQVLVDLSQGRVVRIVTLTVKVVEK